MFLYIFLLDINQVNIKGIFVYVYKSGQIG